MRSREREREKFFKKGKGGIQEQLQNRVILVIQCADITD